MDYCEKTPERFDKVAAVQKQVDEVKNVMIENIEKVLDRGEKIELLVDKTQSLRNSADTFHRQGKQLRRQMWMNNLKMKLLVLFVVAFLGFVIFLMVRARAPPSVPAAAGAPPPVLTRRAPRTKQACKGFSCTK